MKKYLFLLMVFVLFSCGDNHNDINESGIIIAKQYVPASSGSGISYTPSTNGSSGVGIVSISNPEQWMIAIKTFDDNIITKDSKELFFKVKEGDTIIVTSRIWYNKKGHQTFKRVVALKTK